MSNLIVAEIALILGISISDVNVNQSFVQLGGNSLSALTLIAACRRRGLGISMTSILGSPSVKSLLDDIAPFVETTKFYQNSSRVVLVENRCRNSPRKKRKVVPEIAPKLQPSQRLEGPKTCPIPNMQLSLIYGSQKTPGANIIEYIEVHRPENVSSLKRGWRMIVESEPIFRTDWDLQSRRGSLFQRKAVPFRWQEEVVHDQEAFDAALEQQDLSSESTTTSFRVVTLRDHRPGKSKSAILWRVHHALIDGFSSTLIMKKVRRAAAGFPHMPGPSFIDLVPRLKAYREQHKLASRAFWERQKKLHPSPANEILLPEPIKKTNPAKVESFLFHVDTNRPRLPIRLLSVTSASLYFAAWALTMSKYTESNTVVFGAVLSGRDLPVEGVEDTAGPLMNTLPFLAIIREDASSSSFVKEVFDSIVELSHFQWSTPEDGFQRDFQSTIALQFDTTAVEPMFCPVEQPTCRATSDIPLSVLAFENGDIHLDYHPSKFKRSDIETMAGVFEKAINSLADPDVSLGTCLQRSVSYDMRNDLLTLGNCNTKTTWAHSVDHTLLSLFKEVVARTPELIAVESDDTSLTYRELEELSEAVAYELSFFIKPQEVVCVHADGSLYWIIAIYGVLQAGGVYCPLDSSSPAQVRNVNFNSSNSNVFLVPNRRDAYEAPQDCRLTFVVEDIINQLPPPSLQKSGFKPPIVEPSHKAYLCFTSGSTGKPKGVICRHNSLIAFQRDLEVRMFAFPGKRIAQVMSPAFDGSIHEIFSAISYGATLRLKDPTDPFAHLGAVDSTILTPTVAKLLHPRSFPYLSTVVSSSFTRMPKLTIMRFI